MMIATKKIKASNTPLNVAVIGSGYIGTLNACCFAQLGHTVIATDVDHKRVAGLSQGVLPYYEEGLQALLDAGLAKGSLRFTESIAEAVKASDVVVLCVGTPPLPDDKPDLSPLKRAIKQVAEAIDEYRLIIERSTLPIESEAWFTGLIYEHLPENASFDVAIIPQFVQEGTAVQDFFTLDRLVVGIYQASHRKDKVMQQVHALFEGILAHHPDTPVITTTLLNAELIKHGTNAYLAMKTAFVNHMALLCDKTESNIDVVSQGIALDRRINSHAFEASLGYGGVFLPKDNAALLAIASAYNMKLDLFNAVKVANRYHRQYVVNVVEQTFGRGGLRGKTLGVLGLAYQENTNDLREAPSIEILKSLVNRGANFKIHDPMAMPHGKGLVKHASFHEDPYEMAQDIDALLVLSKWETFKTLDLARLAQAAKTKGTPLYLIDARGLFDRQAAKDAGFTYVSIGR
ncbi:MAG: UDP-glucose dehydrogenase family protein [Vampirovibrionales bacterium]